MDKGYILLVIDKITLVYSVCVKEDNDILKAFSGTPATVFNTYKEALKYKGKFMRQAKKNGRHYEAVLILAVESRH